MAMEDEELLLKQLPHSVAAEQAVLGSMLIDSRCIPEVIDKLRPDDFYLQQNREIYETIYSMFNYSLTIDPVTVLEHMRQNGVYDENQHHSKDQCCQNIQLWLFFVARFSVLVIAILFQTIASHKRYFAHNIIFFSWAQRRKR